MFALDRLFKPSIMFAGKPGAYPTMEHSKYWPALHLMELLSKSQLLPLPANMSMTVATKCDKHASLLHYNCNSYTWDGGCSIVTHTLAGVIDVTNWTPL